MKKCIFISTLALTVGAQLFAAAIPTPVRANKNVAKADDLSSSFSSECDDRATFVSAVANGDASTQIVLTGDPILFNTVMDIDGPIAYNPTTGVFTVFEPGSYEIKFGARFSGAIDEEDFDPCAALALLVNGTELPGSEISATYGIEGEFIDNDWASLSVIQTINAPTTFAVIASTNNLGNEIQLFNFSPCNPGNTSAYVTIKKLR